MSCPVDCIHWVRRDELPSLEYMTQKMSQRVDVGTMMGGAGGSVNDVFSAAERFIKSRGKRCEPFFGARLLAQGLMIVDRSPCTLIMHECSRPKEHLCRLGETPCPRSLIQHACVCSAMHQC